MSDANDKGPLNSSALRGTLLLIAASVATGCSMAPTCDEPEFYESAQGGKRIDAPDGLDDLASYKEMVIPEASPREPRPPGSGCLDKPPTLRIENDGSAEEVET